MIDRAKRGIKKSWLWVLKNIFLRYFLGPIILVLGSIGMFFVVLYYKILKRKTKIPQKFIKKCKKKR